LGYSILYFYIMDTKMLGKKIRLLRQEKGLSQENISDELKISVTAFSKIERGATNLPFTRLCQIAGFFDMTVPALLEWNEKKEKKKTTGNSDTSNDIAATYEGSNAIGSLKNEIIQLKELVKAKDEIIALLKQKNRY
jgi:transcriptional regulator with XRE-family HTH domain